MTPRLWWRRVAIARIARADKLIMPKPSDRIPKRRGLNMLLRQIPLKRPVMGIRMAYGRSPVFGLRTFKFQRRVVTNPTGVFFLNCKLRVNCRAFLYFRNGFVSSSLGLCGFLFPQELIKPSPNWQISFRSQCPAVLVCAIATTEK